MAKRRGGEEMGMLRRLWAKLGKMRTDEAPAPLMILLPF